MDRAQWLVKETIHKVRISALHRLFHEGRHSIHSQVSDTVSQQYEQSYNSLDELERGIRGTGPDRPKPGSVQDPAIQSTTRSIQHQEVPNVRNAATQTEGRAIDSCNSPSSLLGALSAETLAALCSLAEKDPGKAIAVRDKSSNLPVLLLQPGIMFMMEDIRSSIQVVNSLEERSRNAVQAILTTYEDIAVSSDDLKETSNGDEQGRDIENEKAMIENAKNNAWKEVLLIDEAISSQKKNLELTRNKFINTIESALSEAELLAPISNKDDAWKAKEHLYNHSVPAILATENASISVVSVDELFRRAALEDLSEAHHRYMDHLDQFENRDDEYENDYREYRQAIEDGTCSLTMTDFDRTYVRNISNLTRCLRKAEAAYEKALDTARRLGLLENEYEQESNFASEVSDGYRESFEASICARVDRRIIERWNEAVLIAGPLEYHGLDTQSLHIEQVDMIEVDEWDAKSVGLSSSVSMKDKSRNRKRIDRWRQ
ncbi:hypothetical protein MMC34_000564 [Xylographa carneopallida]|nr:hypothetical protein [Xylographa carneopallida]